MSPETVHVKSLESAPPRVQEFESPLSVSVTVKESTEVEPSATSGVLSVAE